MLGRGENFQEMPLDIVGSSTFGRYPKISVQETWNMFVSDDWLVDYPGYLTAIASLGKQGRGLYTSQKFDRMVMVIDSKVYLVNIQFNQQTDVPFDAVYDLIGTLQTSSGIVYISENNKPQIAIVDGQSIYIYDPTLTPPFQIATKDGTNPIDFIPGYITFHDTYFLVAASADGFYDPPANNTWRLSNSNDGTQWPDAAANIGLLETKPDNTQAVVRFPSGGNMIFVMGKTVTEPWFDVGYQLFPYQRNTSFNIDYGCLSPATITSTDEFVVWLAVNGKSGPVIMFSDGSKAEKITTDGIDYLFSNLTNPADSQAWMIRQDGHLFYHINFYTDNLSLFIDFNTKKIYHACDEKGDYFIASSVAFFNNQYWFTTKNNGALYALDTIFETYDGLQIPRIRKCRNIRLPKQEYFIANDVGFTIEQGTTNYYQQVIQNSSEVFLQTAEGVNLLAQDGTNLILTQMSAPTYINQTPRVDMRISIDGGESFSSYLPYIMNPIGRCKNKMQWWGLGSANDIVCEFHFQGYGRFVATDGVLNIRQ